MKLYCMKVSHNPYKEEFVTEILEKVFQIDGYSVAERLLEGIPFDVYFSDNGITKIEIADDYSRKYFEDNFNSQRWYQKVKEYAEDILSEGDEVDVPKFIEQKYFKNGINCAFITEDFESDKG